MEDEDLLRYTYRITDLSVCASYALSREIARAHGQEKNNEDTENKNKHHCVIFHLNC